LKNISGIQNAFFSILKPGVHIKPHRGPFSGIMRYHLGVIIPNGAVKIKIDHKEYQWSEGESLIFDDSFQHEVWNNTNQNRVVLFVDFTRRLLMHLQVISNVFLYLIK
jgi:beta-hydroxylase